MGKLSPTKIGTRNGADACQSRFGNGYDVYALEEEGLGQSIVFRNIPLSEIRDSIAAVYHWDGWEAPGLVRAGHRIVPEGRCRHIGRPAA